MIHSPAYNKLSFQKLEHSPPYNQNDFLFSQTFHTLYKPFPKNLPQGRIFIKYLFLIYINI